MAAARPGQGNRDPCSNNLDTRRQNRQPTAEQMPASDEDESVNLQKRRRVSKACDQCRQGKLKCNGAMPRCGTCLKAEKPCSYGATMRRRGLKTGYVRVLECLWGLVFQSIEGSENTVEKLIASTSRKSFWVRDVLRNDLKAVETPWEAWKSSRIPQAVDALLCAADSTDDDAPTVQACLSTEMKDVNTTWSLLDQSTLDQQSQSNAASQVLCQRCRGRVQEQTWRLSNSATSQNQMPAIASMASNQPSQCGLPELPKNPLQLLNRYFALTHSWLPVLERHAVYRSLFAHRKASAAHSVENLKSGETAVLWAIFAYATMMQDPHPNEESLTHKPAPHPEELYIIARNNIPIEKEDNYSIGHVQALLILGLLHYSSSQWTVARTVIGQAILLASHIGLDQPQTDHHRRTWVGCFVLDTLISAHTEKAPWIQSHRVKTFLPIDETGNEEWEPWNLQEALLPGMGAEMAELATPTHALTVFSKLLELLCIANDWICSTTTELKDGWKDALKSWDDGLPEHIRSFGADMFSTAPVSPPPNILNLYMIYASLFERLSCPTSPRPPTGWNRDQEWMILIRALESFFDRFNERAIPPSFNLFRNVLPQQMAENGPICDSLAELEKLCGDKFTGQSQSGLHGQSIVASEKPVSTPKAELYNEAWPSGGVCLLIRLCFCLAQPSEDLTLYNNNNNSGGTITYGINPQMEQDLGSFMDMSGPWSNVATDMLLEPQNAPENPGSLGQPTAHPGGRGELSSHRDFQDVTALGYFNDWNDIEMQV